MSDYMTGMRGWSRGRMAVGFTITYSISIYQR